VIIRRDSYAYHKVGLVLTAISRQVGYIMRVIG